METLNYKNMPGTTAKINLKIGQIEISIEGPSDFVSKQYDKVEAHLKTYSELSSKIEKPTKQKEEEKGHITDKKTHTNIEGGDLPQTFGEWLNIIPKETSDTEKAILAGYFVQLTSENKYFRVRDVTKLLTEHSIKLSNPSQFLKTSVDSKKLFQHSKTGSRANYKLTRGTEDAMKKLLNRS